MRRARMATPPCVTIRFRATETAEGVPDPPIWSAGALSRVGL